MIGIWRYWFYIRRGEIFKCFFSPCTFCPVLFHWCRGLIGDAFTSPVPPRHTPIDSVCQHSHHTTTVTSQLAQLKPVCFAYREFFHLCFWCSVLWVAVWRGQKAGGVDGWCQLQCPPPPSPLTKWLHSLPPHNTSNFTLIFTPIKPHNVNKSSKLIVWCVVAAGRVCDTWPRVSQSECAGALAACLILVLSLWCYIWPDEADKGHAKLYLLGRTVEVMANQEDHSWEAGLVSFRPFCQVFPYNMNTYLVYVTPLTGIIFFIDNVYMSFRWF